MKTFFNKAVDKFHLNRTLPVLQFIHYIQQATSHLSFHFPASSGIGKTQKLVSHSEQELIHPRVQNLSEQVTKAILADPNFSAAFSYLSWEQIHNHFP